MNSELKSIHDLGAGIDKANCHQYLEVYEGFFEPIRNQVENVLEIGIHLGNSHRLWEAYFPNAHIYGMDIHDYGHSFDSGRITAIYGDAYTHEAVQKFDDKKFDIIIDDGAHILSTMQFVVANYINLLAPNGILIIEDIPYGDWIGEIGAFVPVEDRRWMFGIDRRFAPIPASISFYHDEWMFVIDRRFAKNPQPASI